MRTYTRLHMIGVCTKLTIAHAYSGDGAGAGRRDCICLKLTVTLVSVQRAINQSVKLGYDQPTDDQFLISSLFSGCFCFAHVIDIQNHLICSTRNDSKCARPFSPLGVGSGNETN